MKILIYGDFRSPHAHGWAKGVEEAGIEVVRLSSEHTETDGVVVPTDAVAQARSRIARGMGRATSKTPGGFMHQVRSEQRLHTLLALGRLSQRRNLLRSVAAAEKPDLIHALRIPYEGLTALSAPCGAPTIVSCWGQDFVFQAARDGFMRQWMRQTLPRATGLHVDNPEDIERARSLGLRREVPTVVAAGNFGVDESLFFPEHRTSGKTVICARRPSPNVDVEAFLQALDMLPCDDGTVYKMVGLSHKDGLLARFQDSIARGRIELLPDQSHAAFAQVMREADVVVSPSRSDGMPNTVLEGLAVGAHVVAGDLPQLRPLAGGHPQLRLVNLDKPTAIAKSIAASLAADPAAHPRGRLPRQYRRDANSLAVPSFYEDVLRTCGKARR